MILHTVCAGCRQPITLSAPARGGPYCDACLPELNASALELARAESAFLDAVFAGELAEADRWADTLERLAQAGTASLRASAVRLAQLGWPVFPVAPGGKAPAIPRERGGRGVLDATTDVRRVERYWDKHPTTNIGVATGYKFDVVDVDYGKPGAALKWADIRDTGIEIHALVNTPRGLHAYVLPAGDGNLAKVRKLVGIDYRGKGGYVVVPPSVRPDGQYIWWSKPSLKLLE